MYMIVTLHDATHYYVFMKVGDMFVSLHHKLSHYRLFAAQPRELVLSKCPADGRADDRSVRQSIGQAVGRSGGRAGGGPNDKSLGQRPTSV